VHSDDFSWYYIRNFYVTDINKQGQINLIDPDSLKGIHLFNLDHNLDTMFFDEDKNFLYYRGRPMATNLTYILKEGKLDTHNKQYLNDIVSTERVYNETGYIFMYDINSSGKIRQSIEDHYKSLDQSGREIAETFLNKITQIFTEALIENDINQYQLAGDGFIASIPDGNGHPGFGDSINIIKKVCTTVHTKINQWLEKSQMLISAKVTICKGDYTYGKVGGLTSAYSSYVGKILFDLERLQSGLGDYIRSTHSELSLDIKDNKLYFNFDNEDNANEEIFTKIDSSFETQGKEKPLKIDIYVLSEPQDIP